MTIDIAHYKPHTEARVVFGDVDVLIDVAEDCVSIYIDKNGTQIPTVMNTTDASMFFGAVYTICHKQLDD